MRIILSHDANGHNYASTSMALTLIFYSEHISTFNLPHATINYSLTVQYLDARRLVRVTNPTDDDKRFNFMYKHSYQVSRSSRAPDSDIVGIGF